MVRIVGGPAEEIGIAPTGLNTVYGNLLGPSDTLITLGYTGTSYGSLHPRPNFETASSQILFYLDVLRRRNRHAEIVVIGESLGGVIAAHVHERKPRSQVNRLILISPLIYTPDDVERYFVDLRRRTNKEDAKTSVRLINSSASSPKEGKWQTINSHDLFTSFFPKRDKGIKLIQRVRNSNTIPTAIVYGENDETIGVSGLAAFRNLPNLTLYSIAGMEHIVDTASEKRVEITLKRFLDAGVCNEDRPCARW